MNFNIIEEVVTKRKTELTTTRQIETRVKRQVVFEDGKVVEDSGPQISTNTTEDTDKQTTEETEVINEIPFNYIPSIYAMNDLFNIFLFHFAATDIW